LRTCCFTKIKSLHRCRAKLAVTPRNESMSSIPINPLKKPLSELRGVGPQHVKLLEKLDLRTVDDLLLHKPRRYEDRRHFKRISETKMGEPTTVFGKVVAMGLKKFKMGTRSVFELVLDDGSARLHCRWWNLPFMEKYFQVGDQVLAYGKIESFKPRTIDHPETEVMESGEEISIHLNRIAPIYPLTEGLPQRWLRALAWRTLQEFEAQIQELNPQIVGAEVKRLTSDDAKKNQSLFMSAPTSLSRSNAIHMLHFPEDFTDIETARRRLALDEFIDIQLAMQKRRQKLEANARALPCSGDNRFIKQFLAKLGFHLTEAQTKVLREMRSDLGGKVPMRRLLQGDVGSGKTVVAGCCALMTLESGFNVALMAPTEILAEQHFQTFRKWFSPLGIAVELLTGSVKTIPVSPSNQPSLLPSTIDTRLPTLFIGTHALVEDAFVPKNLGLVVIDEQHKFGVAQREKLLKKGRYPHLLVMTATPIPRTLGLTLYGDLDISVIDELPAGRGKIKTFVRTEDKLPKVWDFVRQKIEEGRQIYVVYPRVEDSGAGELKAVTIEFEKLRKLFSPHLVGLLHGRIKSDEKEQIMTTFRANKVKMLVATSVIEVGVDVANATIMVVENADRFGLAQLHQLRGRIGRGTHESYCILIASAKNEASAHRLKILEETGDGFRIAEEDLKLRGPGELIGNVQSGLPPFRFGDFVEDRRLVEEARMLVGNFLKNKQDAA
jgi:ATP-dependent DNA helicase RecG